jgi:hypothetical protein
LSIPELRHCSRFIEVKGAISKRGVMSKVASGPPERRDPFWPAAIITFGIGLTAAWVILLAYGLIKLVEHAI